MPHIASPLTCFLCAHLIIRLGRSIHKRSGCSPACALQAKCHERHWYVISHLCPFPFMLSPPFILLIISSFFIFPFPPLIPFFQFPITVFQCFLLICLSLNLSALSLSLSLSLSLFVFEHLKVSSSQQYSLQMRWRPFCLEGLEGARLAPCAALLISMFVKSTFKNSVILSKTTCW